ncbi:hypothetical protein FBQ80_17435 [Candidatus Brocadia sp. AMX2]|uniref:hypothetical protein n=1 Tax=Candidatus Brocadia TaxID=380240 RepID=UPI0012FE8BF7|nr:MULTISPECIES: hypothetical protein [Brocadia]MDL1937308.1 hypothetical protein [Candidatus Brocadia sp. AMX2]NOG41904.1 hypothetical protein [Planctomycetota bacterium]
MCLSCQVPFRDAGKGGVEVRKEVGGMGLWVREQPVDPRLQEDVLEAPGYGLCHFPGCLINLLL